MKKLLYTFKTDTLFKLLFTKYPDLLKRLVSALLNIKYESIEQFIITNPEISPEELGKKFCRLDINMFVNGQKVCLEIQVVDEGNYIDRSLYYWAREFSTGLSEGEDYDLLPRTIIISILGFNQFPDPEKYHSEFQCLEVTNHVPLTDKMVLHYFELNKIQPVTGAESDRDLWLKLFKVETEEELIVFETMEEPVMNEAVGAYRHIASSQELREFNIKRAMSKAEHDEAQAIKNAERRGEARAEARAEAKWQEVINDKDAEITIKNAEIVNKDTEIARLSKLIAEMQSKNNEK